MVEPEREIERKGPGEREEPHAVGELPLAEEAQRAHEHPDRHGERHDARHHLPLARDEDGDDPGDGRYDYRIEKFVHVLRLRIRKSSSYRCSLANLFLISSVFSWLSLIRSPSLST